MKKTFFEQLNKNYEITFVLFIVVFIVLFIVYCIVVFSAYHGFRYHLQCHLGLNPLYISSIQYGINWIRSKLN